MVKAFAAFVAAFALTAPSPPSIASQLGLKAVEPLLLAKALSSRIVHGDRDDAAPPWQMRAGIEGGLVLTCGPAVAFVRGQLAAHGFASRPVQLRANSNTGFDDGHVLLEVDTAKGPVLIDVAQKRLFLIDSKPASGREVARESFERVTLTSFAPARVDPSFSHAAYVETIYRNPRPWYARMFARN